MRKISSYVSNVLFVANAKKVLSLIRDIFLFKRVCAWYHLNVGQSCCEVVNYLQWNVWLLLKLWDFHLIHFSKMSSKFLNCILQGWKVPPWSFFVCLLEHSMRAFKNFSVQIVHPSNFSTFMQQGQVKAISVSSFQKLDTNQKHVCPAFWMSICLWLKYVSQSLSKKNFCAV